MGGPKNAPGTTGAGVTPKDPVSGLTTKTHYLSSPSIPPPRKTGFTRGKQAVAKMAMGRCVIKGGPSEREEAMGLPKQTLYFLGARAG